MLTFWYCTEDVLTDPIGYSGSNPTRYSFSSITEEDRKSGRISFNKTYFSTSNDFTNHKNNLIKTGKNPSFQPILAKDIERIPNFPERLGFSKKPFEETFKKYIEEGEISIAITNAMSNAIGDHMIGMIALRNFREELSKHIPDDKITINLFQLSPYKLRQITEQWKGVWQNVFIMPSSLDVLLSHDVLFDLGGFLLYESFDKQPLMSFFEEVLSIKSLNIDKDKKRIIYKPNDQSKKKIRSLMNIVRKKSNPVDESGRSPDNPILLYHNLSTTPLRSIPNSLAKKHIEEILENSNFFVVSATGLDFEHERFLNLNQYSSDLDDFASIISEVDAAITVDPCAYHLADAFSTPTVAIFSTIDPSKRCENYPFVKGVLLEENGILKDCHKVEVHDPDASEKIEHSKNLFKSLKIQDVLNDLSELMGHSGKVNNNLLNKDV